MSDPTLTHHAWHRWCERAWPASYDTVRCYLLTPERRMFIAMGVLRINMPADGVTLIVRDGAIITTMPLIHVKRNERIKQALRLMYQRVVA